MTHVSAVHLQIPQTLSPVRHALLNLRVLYVQSIVVALFSRSHTRFHVKYLPATFPQKPECAKCDIAM